MDDTEFEWEKCKENVQRIRGGRSMTKIINSLKNSDNECILNEQRREFENDLRIYTGDDPLDIWSRYVKWTEENYWMECKSSQKFELVEKCIRKFNEGNQYANDMRFLEIWIHFIGFCKDPLVVCKYLYQRQFFLKLARFYQIWAEYTELQNTTKSGSKHVDSIFLKGVANEAEPLDWLKCLHSQFLMRSIKKTLNSQADDNEMVDMDICEDTRSERKALGFLKSDSSRAPINRVGHRTEKSSVIKSNKANMDAFQMTCENARPSEFNVFVDKQNPTIIDELDSMKSTNPRERLPRTMTSEIDKENRIKPGKWKKPKDMTTRVGRHNAQSFVTPAKSTFKIFCDEPEEETIQKPSASKVNRLSIRKKVKLLHDDIFEELLHYKDIKPTTVFDFDFDILYEGVNEFSFEEILAAKWFSLNKDSNFLPMLGDDKGLSTIVEKLHLEDTPSIDKHKPIFSGSKYKKQLKFDIISENSE